MSRSPTVIATAVTENPFISRSVLGVHVAVSSYDELIQKSIPWARQRHSRALFFAAVHMVMEFIQEPVALARLNDAITIFPDGMPLVWALRMLGERRALRVCGADAMVKLLAAAEKAGISVGFYGGSPDALDALISEVRLRHPNLNVAYAESPPFRALTPEEDEASVERIATSGVQLLFVGLGCPKQESWIIEHLGRVNAVMCAVGAAFDFIAGSKRRAPRWMQRCGLEWLFRLAIEPRRLAIRYLKHNPCFVLKFLRQLLTRRA